MENQPILMEIYDKNRNLIETIPVDDVDDKAWEMTRKQAMVVIQTRFPSWMNDYYNRRFKFVGAYYDNGFPMYVVVQNKLLKTYSVVMHSSKNILMEKATLEQVQTQFGKIETDDD